MNEYFLNYLFISSIIHNTLPEQAKHIDSSSILLDHNTFNNIPTRKYSSMYTSLKNITQEQLIYTIKHTKEIIYIEQPYKDHNPIDNELLEILTILSKNPKIIIRNIPNSFQTIYNDCPFTLPRKSSDKQLWIAGCSISEGVGVPEEHSYKNIISDNLNLEYTLLAKTATSNKFQSSMILRSDIKKDDIICWGLTSINRFPLYGVISTDNEHNYNEVDGNIFHINSWAYEDKISKDIIPKYIPLDLLYSDHMLYETIIAIQSVVNFCDKIGATLLLQGLLIDPEISRFFEAFPIFKQTYNNTFLDLGYDGLHPGIKTHQLYAETFLQLLEPK